MKTGPRYKIAKRLGTSVFEKAQTQKFAVSQARSEKNKKMGRRRGGRTAFAVSMLEKQKVRVTYGVGEQQFRNYVRAALEAKGADPVDALHAALELRLDNVVYRMGLAATRRAARQMVAHGHITVDGKKVWVPSHRVRMSEKIGIREGSKAHALLQNLVERFSERPTSSWLTFDPRSMEGAVAQMPTRESADPAGDLASVISFYTR